MGVVIDQRVHILRECVGGLADLLRRLWMLLLLRVVGVAAVMVVGVVMGVVVVVVGAALLSDVHVLPGAPSTAWTLQSLTGQCVRLALL